jgi:N6-adenosine-specific RNA methylase IME4
VPVKEVAADAALLYLWTTNAFMAEAHEVALLWGFHSWRVQIRVQINRHSGTRPHPVPFP